MAVKIGKDGTLYCNSVKYTYKQTKNIVADSGFLGNVWSLTSSARVTDTSVKSPYGIKISGTISGRLTQNAPAPIANHKYYSSVFFRAINSTAGSVPYINEFRWVTPSNGLSTDPNKKMQMANINYNTGGTLVKASGIVTAGSSPISEQWSVSISFSGSSSLSAEVYLPIIVDLTESFGAGNEPTKAWCDEHILEFDCFYNHYHVMTGITKDNYNTAWNKGGFLNITFYNYRQLGFQQNYPSDYLFDLYANPNSVESIMYQQATVGIVQGNYYYFGCELTTPSFYEGTSADCYIPEAEPSLGNVPFVINTAYSGGGGMWGWKRYGFYNIRNNWPSGNMLLRFDINNLKKSTNNWGTNFFLLNATGLLTRLKSNFGWSSSIDMSYFNKSWFDRYAGGQNASIIRIKDPNVKKIKLNKDYDIICNDIVIDPTITKVKFDKSTGTIYCRKLVKQKNY